MNAARLRHARAGFTLIEVLLTLLIMGGIMLSMTQILTAARTSRDTIHNIQETQLAGPAILDLIEHDLRGIFTYDRTRSLQMRVKNRVILGYDADSLDFVTTTDSLSYQQFEERFVRGDVNEVGYRLRPNPDSADQFPILRAAHLLRLKPTGLCGGDFGFGETFAELFTKVELGSIVSATCTPVASVVPAAPLFPTEIV